MNDNISLRILESYVEIDKLHDSINNKIFDFITKANELVELSDDDYQIEKSLRLNKISLKSYILDSPLCVGLKENNITDYSIDELKKYLSQYEENFNEDGSKYNLAILLYELAEDIEKLVDSKINLEIKELTVVLPSIKNIMNINKLEYKKLYINMKNQLTDDLNSNKLDEKTYNVCIQILNDIFNFYISGYPNIPDEYLYRSDDV